MTDPKRLLGQQGAIPESLHQALRDAPGAPSAAELQALAARVSAAVGVPLAASSTGTVAKLGWTLSAWVAGGTLLGVGLSAAVTYGVATADGPTPHGSAARPTATSTAAIPELPPAPSARPPAPTEPGRRSDTRPSRPTVLPNEAAPAASETPPPREAELAMLQLAQRVSKSDPAQALSLCSQHAAQFPNGILGQEREVIAIEALLALGRRGEAAARAEAFEAHYPGSAHARRLRAMVENGGAP